MSNLRISNLEAIIYHLEAGHDNGGIPRGALVLFLKGVLGDLNTFNEIIEIIERDRTTDEEK